MEQFVEEAADYSFGLFGRDYKPAIRIGDKSSAGSIDEDALDGEDLAAPTFVGREDFAAGEAEALHGGMFGKDGLLLQAIEEGEVAGDGIVGNVFPDIDDLGLELVEQLL